MSQIIPEIRHVKNYNGRLPTRAHHKAQIQAQETSEVINDPDAAYHVALAFLARFTGWLDKPTVHKRRVWVNGVDCRNLDEIVRALEVELC